MDKEQFFDDIRRKLQEKVDQHQTKKPSSGSGSSWFSKGGGMKTPSLKASEKSEGEPISLTEFCEKHNINSRLNVALGAAIERLSDDEAGQSPLIVLLTRGDEVQVCELGQVASFDEMLVIAGIPHGMLRQAMLDGNPYDSITVAFTGFVGTPEQLEHLKDTIQKTGDFESVFASADKKLGIAHLTKNKAFAAEVESVTELTEIAATAMKLCAPMTYGRKWLKS